MRVKDVMTAGVLTVSPTTPLRHAAQMLAEHGISGLPVVSPDGYVVGVLSEGDIVIKEAGVSPEKRGVLRRIASPPPFESELKIAATTVGEAMSVPAVTIDENRPVSVAANTMVSAHVNRLPVVDVDGRLIGIVTRADLVRAFVRSDEELAGEIREEVLRRTLWLDGEQVLVEVEDGEVFLTGEVETKSDAELIPTFVQRVPGVVSVLSKLRWRAA